MLKYLVSNSYVAYAGKIFLQTSGIPMGANYSPVLANLCLAFMEYKYVLANPVMGRRLAYTVRYIDDLLSLGSEALEEAAKDIYPASLPLSFDDTSEGKGHYLDLLIDMNDKSIGLFDKRLEFQFNVIRYTDSESNVPREAGLNVMYSQAVRLARICTAPDDFESSLRDIIRIMNEKGFFDGELIATMEKVRIRYQALLIRQGLRTKREVKRIVVSTVDNREQGQ
jgi:hypothetical protein